MPGTLAVRCYLSAPRNTQEGETAVRRFRIVERHTALKRDRIRGVYHGKSRENQRKGGKTLKLSCMGNYSASMDEKNKSMRKIKNPEQIVHIAAILRTF